MILEFNSDPTELKNVRQKVEDFCRDNLIKGNILNNGTKLINATDLQKCLFLISVINNF